MLRIGYLGPEGTFSSMALDLYAHKLDCAWCKIPYMSIYSLLRDVCEGRIDDAVVPIENSIEGGVSATMDILSEKNMLMIKNEIIIKVEQNLIGHSGANIKEIKRVLSHPQALGQCSRFISLYLPHAQNVFCESTVAAIRKVKEEGIESGAIGSRYAADLYGLEVLMANIHDEDNNHTRFVAVSTHDSCRTGKDKTSIVFSTEDKPGSLYRILDILNLWDINMTRIESRPAKNELGKYIFFVDMEGHREDTDVRDALAMIRRKCSYFKFLGSYPAGICGQ